MGKFEDAAQRLIQKFQRSIGIDLVYHAGDDAITLIKKCWVGRTAFRIQDNKGSRLIFSDRDFFIPVVDLVINSVQILPEKGHWIEQILNGPEGTQKFELMSPDQEPCWRYSDPQRFIYRIHTKRVSLS